MILYCKSTIQEYSEYRFKNINQMCFLKQNHIVHICKYRILNVNVFEL